MRIHLLDTCAVSDWADENSRGHDRLHETLREQGDPPLAISPVSIAEIEYGIALTPIGPSKRDAMRTAVKKYTTVAPSTATATPYAKLRAWLFENKAPKNMRRVRRISQLVDPATDLQLQIQENDLWLVSQALENSFVLVTRDKMKALREGAKACGEELQILGW